MEIEEVEEAREVVVVDLSVEGGEHREDGVDSLRAVVGIEEDEVEDEERREDSPPVVEGVLREVVEVIDYFLINVLYIFHPIYRTALFLFTPPPLLRDDVPSRSVSPYPVTFYPFHSSPKRT